MFKKRYINLNMQVNTNLYVISYHTIFKKFII